MENEAAIDADLFFYLTVAPGKRLGQARETFRNHLAEMLMLANPPNSDLSGGFTVPTGSRKALMDRADGLVFGA